MHLKHTCLPISPPELSGFFDAGVEENSNVYAQEQFMLLYPKIEFHLWASNALSP